MIFHIIALALLLIVLWVAAILATTILPLAGIPLLICAAVLTWSAVGTVLDIR